MTLRSLVHRMQNTHKNPGTSLLGLAAVALFSVTGCSNTVRMVTATQWVHYGDGEAKAAPLPAPASTSGSPSAGTAGDIPPGGAAGANTPPPKPSEPEKATAQGSAATSYVLYVAYWEGSCSRGPFSSGCSRGDSKIKRCNVSADNTMVCVDEKDANRILATDAK